MGPNGGERRKYSHISGEDRDILIRLDSNMSNLIELVNHNRKETKMHIADDNINFKAIGVELSNLEKSIQTNSNWVKGIILPVMGGSAVIMFLLNWFHK